MLAGSVVVTPHQVAGHGHPALPHSLSSSRTVHQLAAFHMFIVISELLPAYPGSSLLLSFIRKQLAKL